MLLLARAYEKAGKKDDAKKLYTEIIASRTATSSARSRTPRRRSGWRGCSVRLSQRMARLGAETASTMLHG